MESFTQNTLKAMPVDTSDVLKDAGLGASIGSVIPGVGTLIGGAGGAALGLIGGLFQKKKGNELLKQNPFPNEPLPSEISANQEIAKGAAIEGTPSEQYLNAKRDIERNQASAVAAASTTPGGAVRNIGAIQQASNDATGNLNAQSALARRQNISQLIGVNNEAASWKSRLFDANQRQKYIQNYNYGMGLVGQGNQNLVAGADKLLGTAAGAAASGVFGGGAGATTSTAPPTYSSPGLQLADTGGGNTPSPAGQFGGYINPNSAPQLIGG
jgi:hypothetical protein